MVGPFHGPGVLRGRGGQRPADRGHEKAPDTVLRETLQGEVVEPGVLRTVCDSLAALSQPVADLEVDEPSDAGVGGQGGQPIATDVLEAQLGALMGPLSAHG